VIERDVLVIGGGPVGLSAAIDARLRGLSVALVEPRRGVIDKACGEGLMPGALPLLNRLGVHPSGHELAGVIYRDEKHEVTHRFSHGCGLGVRRTMLSSALRARADETGVDFVQASLSSVSQNHTAVTAVCSNEETVQGRYLIGADGLHSTVAKLAGLTRPARPNRRRRFGIRQHFSVAPWSSFIEVFYTRDAEVYITPVSETQIGVAVLGPRSTDFESVIGEVPELAERIQGADRSSERAGAGSFPQKTIARRNGRILLVGDASGYVDAITGEGLRLGFAQAREALTCIESDQPEHYERKWRQVSRDFRVLTIGLTALAQSPLRNTIVPLAERVPKLFGFIVDRLAK